MANIESVKVYFESQKVEETNQITDIKILMLKGEKGDTVSAQWGTITGTLANQEDLNNELTTMAGNISTNASDILSLNTRVGADESSISDIDGRVATNTSDISTLDGKVTTNTSNISSLGSRVTTLETDMGNYDTRITTNTNNITELDGRVTTNTNNIAGLVVNTLTGDETTKAPAVNAVNDALTNINDEITDINGDISDINGEITDLKNDDKVIVSPTEPTGDERKKVWLQKGKNLFNANVYTFESGDINSSNGSNETNANRVRLKDYFPVEPNTTYSFSDAGNTGARLVQYDSNFGFVKFSSVVTITTEATTRYLRWSYTQTTTPTNVQVEKGSTATTYEPYVDDKEYILNSNNVYEEFKKEEVIDITSLSGGASINSTYWRNRLIKQGKICHLELAFAPNSTSNITIYQLPAGFYSSGNTATIGLLMRDSTIGKAVITNGGAVQVQVPSASGNTWSLNMTWVVD